MNFPTFCLKETVGGKSKIYNFENFGKLIFFGLLEFSRNETKNQKKLMKKKSWQSHTIETTLIHLNFPSKCITEHSKLWKKV